MRITVYAGEYGESPGLKKEYGLGLLFETGYHTGLFDFGDKTGKANLAALGQDARCADVAVLSHGHKENGGGLPALYPDLIAARKYARETAFQAHYFKKSRLSYKTVSLPKKTPTGDWIWTKSFLQLDEELTLLSNFKPEKENEAASRFFVDGDKFFLPDTFAHEQALLITEKGKQFLLVGGGHAGLRQMIGRAEKTYSRPVDAVIGGLSLTDGKGRLLTDEERLRDLSFELEKETSARFYFACGVSGDAFRIMQEVLGARVRQLSVGESKEL